MNKKHLKVELSFYKNAFSKNKKRRILGYGWQFNPSKTTKEIIIANKLTTEAKGKRVLDLGCGDGRHVKLFREMGFEVVGVDFSDEAIRLCKKKFKNDKKIKIYKIDLTEKNSLSKLGKFDLVLDWSVLDHIRKKYIKKYMANILSVIKKDGYAIFSEFDISMPGLFKNKNYKLTGKHYSKAYTIKSLLVTVRPLKLVDCRKAILEDEVNNNRFNTVLVNNTAKL